MIKTKDGILKNLIFIISGLFILWIFHVISHFLVIILLAEYTFYTNISLPLIHELAVSAFSSISQILRFIITIIVAFGGPVLIFISLIKRYFALSAILAFLFPLFSPIIFIWLEINYFKEKKWLPFYSVFIGYVILCMSGYQYFRFMASN